MGRSQRHLREVQHIDSQGYDVRWKGYGEGRRGLPWEDEPEEVFEDLANTSSFENWINHNSGTVVQADTYTPDGLGAIADRVTHFGGSYVWQGPYSLTAGITDKFRIRAKSSNSTHVFFNTSDFTAHAGGAVFDLSDGSVALEHEAGNVTLISAEAEPLAGEGEYMLTIAVQSSDTRGINLMVFSCNAAGNSASTGTYVWNAQRLVLPEE